MALQRSSRPPAPICLHLHSPAPVAGARLNSCRLRHSLCRAGAPRVATVEVDVGSAVERISVQLSNESSRLVKCQLQFPLGLVFEASAGSIVVAEVTPDGNAAAQKVRPGDVLRGVTAFTMQMTYPTMNLMFGGVGRPKRVKILLPVTGQPFPAVMEAVRSNREEGDGSIVLVLERGGGAGASSQPGAAAAAAAAAAAGSQAQSAAPSSSSSSSSNGGGTSTAAPPPMGEGAGEAAASSSSSSSVPGEPEPAQGAATGGDDKQGGVFDPRLFE